MLARLFVLVGGLLVLALTAALVGPYFVDWTTYRADFEREASAILGRKVTVEGEASATLLPFPSVTFSDVSVSGGANGEPAMTIETFSMDAELAPFMRGEFLIFDMRLVRPKGTIDIAADGTVDWTMRPSAPFDAGTHQRREADRHGRPDHRAPRGKRAHASAYRGQHRGFGEIADRSLADRRHAADSTACAWRSRFPPARSTRTARCG